MKKIERPDWQSISSPVLHLLCPDALNAWFDTKLKDHYAVHKDDLKEVHANFNDTDGHCRWIYPATYFTNTHKAYLIKSSIEPLHLQKTCTECGQEIEAGSPAGDPIKQETCADVLRYILDCDTLPADHPEISHIDLMRKIKAALERQSRNDDPERGE